MGNIHMQLTEKGKALNAKIQAGKGTIPLEITRVVSASSFSDCPLSLATLAELDIRQTARIVRQETVGTRAVIEVQLSNQGNMATGEPPITIGYELFQMGMGAVDPDDGEILYRISQFETSTWIPPATEMGWTVNPSWNFVVGNAGKVVVEIDPSGMATVGQLQNHIDDRVYSGSGVHGIRFRDRRLEVHDGNRWLTLLRHGNFRVLEGMLSHDLGFGSVEENGDGSGTLAFENGFARAAGSAVILD